MKFRDSILSSKKLTSFILFCSCFSRATDVNDGSLERGGQMTTTTTNKELPLKVTSQYFDGIDDHNAACRDEFGEMSSVADWDFHLGIYGLLSDEEDVNNTEILESLGIVSGKSSKNQTTPYYYFVTTKGSKNRIIRYNNDFNDTNLNIEREISKEPISLYSGSNIRGRIICTSGCPENHVLVNITASSSNYCDEEYTFAPLIGEKEYRREYDPLKPYYIRCNKDYDDCQILMCVPSNECIRYESDFYIDTNFNSPKSCPKSRRIADVSVSYNGTEVHLQDNLFDTYSRKLVAEMGSCKNKECNKEEEVQISVNVSLFDTEENNETVVELFFHEQNRIDFEYDHHGWSLNDTIVTDKYYCDIRRNCKNLEEISICVPNNLPLVATLKMDREVCHNSDVSISVDGEKPSLIGPISSGYFGSKIYLSTKIGNHDNVTCTHEDDSNQSLLVVEEVTSFEELAEQSTVIVLTNSSLATIFAYTTNAGLYRYNHLCLPKDECYTLVANDFTGGSNTYLKAWFDGEEVANFRSHTAQSANFGLCDKDDKSLQLQECKMDNESMLEMYLDFNEKYGNMTWSISEDGVSSTEDKKSGVVLTSDDRKDLFFERVCVRRNSCITLNLSYSGSDYYARSAYQIRFDGVLYAGKFNHDDDKFNHDDDVVENSILLGDCSSSKNPCDNQNDYLLDLNIATPLNEPHKPTSYILSELIRVEKEYYSEKTVDIWSYNRQYSPFEKHRILKCVKKEDECLYLKLEIIEAEKMKYKVQIDVSLDGKVLTAETTKDDKDRLDRFERKYYLNNRCPSSSNNVFSGGIIFTLMMALSIVFWW